MEYHFHKTKGISLEPKQRNDPGKKKLKLKSGQTDRQISLNSASNSKCKETKLVLLTC